MSKSPAQRMYADQGQIEGDLAIREELRQQIADLDHQRTALAQRLSVVDDAWKVVNGHLLARTVSEGMAVAGIKRGYRISSVWCFTEDRYRSQWANVFYDGCWKVVGSTQESLVVGYGTNWTVPVSFYNEAAALKAAIEFVTTERMHDRMSNEIRVSRW